MQSQNEARMSEARKSFWRAFNGASAAKVTTEQKIVRYFADVHLGNGHHGLAAMAKDHGVNVQDLARGEYVIYVNRARNALKLFAPGNIVAHLKLPESDRLDMRVIASIPRFFNGKSIDYKGALKEQILKDLSPKR